MNSDRTSFPLSVAQNRRPEGTLTRPLLSVEKPLPPMSILQGTVPVTHTNWRQFLQGAEFRGSGAGPLSWPQNSSLVEPASCDLLHESHLLHSHFSCILPAHFSTSVEAGILKPHIWMVMWIVRNLHPRMRMDMLVILADRDHHICVLGSGQGKLVWELRATLPFVA